MSINVKGVTKVDWEGGVDATYEEMQNDLVNCDAFCKFQTKTLFFKQIQNTKTITE